MNTGERTIRNVEESHCKINDYYYLSRESYDLYRGLSYNEDDPFWWLGTWQDDLPPDEDDISFKNETKRKTHKEKIREEKYKKDRAAAKQKYNLGYCYTCPYLHYETNSID